MALKKRTGRRYLKRVESKILLFCKALRKNLDRDADTQPIIDAHLLRISEFYDFPAKQETMTSPNLKLLKLQ